ARRLLGARTPHAPQKTETPPTETAQGWSVEASHDAYAAAFGVRHERQVTLSSQGLAVTGADRLLPRAAKAHRELNFAIRFHVHPDVRMSPSQGGAILLKL